MAIPDPVNQAGPTDSCLVLGQLGRVAPAGNQQQTLCRVNLTNVPPHPALLAFQAAFTTFKTKKNSYMPP